MSRILVTGATGHLGKVVAEELLKRTDAANIAVLVKSSGGGKSETCFLYQLPA